jgi:hypothetical protein
MTATELATTGLHYGSCVQLMCVTISTLTLRDRLDGDSQAPGGQVLLEDLLLCRVLARHNHTLLAHSSRPHQAFH